MPNPTTQEGMELPHMNPVPSMELSEFQPGERAVSEMACRNYARLYADEAVAADRQRREVDAPTRYDYGYGRGMEGMFPRKDGAYVKWADVRHLFAADGVASSAQSQEKKHD